MQRDAILAERATRNGVGRQDRPRSIGAKTTSTDRVMPAAVMSDDRSHDAATFANATAYLRVSTDQQADSGLGLEAQRSSVTAAAVRLGLVLREVHVDAGTSGALPLGKRPVLMRAVSAVQRGEVLLVAKRDRLARDWFEVAVIERDLVKHGARLVSAAGEGTENDDPASVLMRGVIDVVAQYERSIGRVRTKNALAAKRARGERVGQLPFGFQLAADKVHLEPNPIEQDKLARIRDLKATGHSTRKITDVLNADGVTTRRGTPYRFQYVARALRQA